MITVMTDEATIEIANARTTDDGLWLSSDDAARATGWTVKPEGFCKGEICVPVPPGRAPSLVGAQGEINVANLWRHLDMPLAHDEARETWVLGTSAAERAERLRSLAAPDFALPDLAGMSHSLAAHRGKKVLLVSWASW
jgi:hypothetical protein